MTFETWLHRRNITLRDWQRVIATEMLSAMRPLRGKPYGKTFLLHVLSEFVNEYGNDYDIETESFAAEAYSDDRYAEFCSADKIIVETKTIPPYLVTTSI